MKAEEYKQLLRNEPVRCSYNFCVTGRWKQRM